jgi:hypothetical protein
MAHDVVITAINPPDGSTEADKCATFYPIARDELLEQHAWRFALRRDALATLANPSLIWRYAYALPNNCIRPLAVLLAGSTDDKQGQSFTIELQADGVSPMILTNAPPGAVLKYIIQQRDSTKFTPSFVVALSYRLSSYLAGAIPKDLNLKASLYAQSETKRQVAAGLDAESEKNDAYGDSFIPAHLLVRQQ